MNKRELAKCPLQKNFHDCSLQETITRLIDEKIDREKQLKILTLAIDSALEKIEELEYQNRKLREQIEIHDLQSVV